MRTTKLSEDEMEGGGGNRDVDLEVMVRRDGIDFLIYIRKGFSWDELLPLSFSLSLSFFCFSLSIFFFYSLFLSLSLSLSLVLIS